jgi:hypothetical protein
MIKIKVPWLNKISQGLFQNSKPKKVELTIESLQADNQKLVEENEQLIQENTLLTDINKELVQKVEELSQLKRPELIEAKATEATPSIPSETFAVNGVQYRFTTPAFVYKQKRFTAAEALNDTELLNELVEKKIGFIKEA